ncbi:MAG: substrate-binding domain-containing protein [Christensenellales bacterium]|jgi:ribose transport system substrate-binding protein
MKKIVSLLLALILMTTICVVVVGCGGTAVSEEGSADEKAAFAGDGTQEYHMVTFVSGIEYWKGCFEGFEQAAKQLGVKAHYAGTTEYEVTAAVTEFEQVVAKNPAGIAVTVMNADAYTDAINSAIDAGIPIVTFDADSPNSDRYCFLATGNAAAGAAAAAELAGFMGHEGKIGIVSCPGQSNHEERLAGFQSYMDNNEPNIEIVQVVNGESDEAISASVTAAMLQANPDITGIFTTAEASAIAIVSSLEEAGMSDKVKVMGFDKSDAILNAIDTGKMQGTVSQNTFHMGYWSMMMLYALKNDLLQENWQENGWTPLPGYVDTGVTIITKENLASYYKPE